MLVVEHGTFGFDRNDNRLHFSCGRCGCKFLAYKDECNIVDVTDGKPSHIGLSYSTRCPECNCPIEITEWQCPW